MKHTLILVNHFYKHSYELRHSFGEGGSLFFKYYEVLLDFLNLDLESMGENFPSKLSILCRQEPLDPLVQLQTKYRSLILNAKWESPNSCIPTVQRNYFLEQETTSRLILPAFEIGGIEEYLYFEWMHLLASQHLPNVCEYCHRFFFPTNRSDEKYCDFINENHKTCKQIGYVNTVKNKNPFQFEYRKAYKTQYARIRYFTNIENYKELYFDAWNGAALSAKKEFEERGDLDGFREWLKESHKCYHPKKDGHTTETLYATL